MKKMLLVILVGSVLATAAHAEDAKSEKALLARYAQLLKDRPDIKKKVDSGRATKEEVLEWMRRGGDKRKGKDYNRARVEVKDPTKFRHSEDLFSGPQPGEKLPSLNVVGLRGESKGQAYDPVKRAGDKPAVFIFQNNSVVGQKGLLLTGPALTRIAKNSADGLFVSATFLVDDPAPRSVFEYDFVDQIAEVIQLSVSSDGRDGPGIYGLNRNVAMTIIVARGGKVLHNFALTQPMLYPDPHVMGAIAEAIGVEQATLASWANRRKSP